MGRCESGSLCASPLFCIYSLCTGVVAFLWHDRLHLSLPLTLISVLTYLSSYEIKVLSVFAMIPLTYIMIWVGMQAQL